MDKYHLYRHKRRTIILISIILLLIIYLFKNASITLRATSTILFLAFFYFIDHYFNIKFRPIHYIFIILIGIFSLMLSPLYYLYPNYDKVQHLIQPLLISTILFFMINKLKIKTEWK